MNTKHLFLASALALLGSSAAFAQSEIDLQHFGQEQTSVVSRAAVRADVQTAKAQGALTTPSEVLAAAIPDVNRSEATRLQVRRELAKTATPQDRGRIGAGY